MTECRSRKQTNFRSPSRPPESTENSPPPFGTSLAQPVASYVPLHRSATPSRYTEIQQLLGGQQHFQVAASLRFRQPQFVRQGHDGGLHPWKLVGLRHDFQFDKLSEPRNFIE